MRVIACLTICCALWSPRLAPAVDTADEEFFEKEVRPLLARHCHECHGPGKQESGLRLDSREGSRRAGASGTAAVVPGKPDESLLLKAVGYEGDLQMPPNGKLADEEIAVLRRWIESGAPWPQSDAATEDVSQLSMSQRVDRARQQHWAYQPVSKAPPPALEPHSQAWGRSPLDAFIAARLNAVGLPPSPETDRRTLIRRATFDLLGVPPAYEDVQAFVDDESPFAYERLIDRLLASPLYGQRWGRHWLDVARYADTRGYSFGREERYPFAWTYRDYVIAAFNEDKPYDRFVLEQLAADHLPSESGRPDDKRSWAALGFLTVGRRFDENVHDVIDDRIDTVTRGLMGVTVHCARCHDHKFDPVPTADYYSLYGVFAGSVEPDDPPLLGVVEDSAEARAFQERFDALRGEHESFRRSKHVELLAELRDHVTRYLAAVAQRDDDEAFKGEAFLSLDPGELRPQVVRRWRNWLAEQKPDDPVFGAWVEFSRLSRGGGSGGDVSTFAQQAAGVVERLKQRTSANARVQQAFVERPPQSMLDVSTTYGRLLATAHQAWQELLKSQPPGDPSQALPDAADEQLRQVLYAEHRPANVTVDEAGRLFDRATTNKLGELKKQYEAFRVNSPHAPPRAMALIDAPEAYQPRIFVRGDAQRQGDPVARRFLEVLSSRERRPFERGSGRLELAQAIVDPGNPLTPRVIVNRVWLQLFGRGLSTTPSDFGARGDPPSHPELLDFLAAGLVESGWSLKSLHREIMLSATYRQSSADRGDGRAADPENRLVWRMNLRRLEFEPLRDSLLAAAGNLDLRFGGRSVELEATPHTQRRTVYGYIDRQNLPTVFRVFDLANPDATSPQRPRTTVPQQALFVMNSPFVLEQAEALAGVAELSEGEDVAARITATYRFALSREPSKEEFKLALAFIAAGEDQPARRRRAPTAWVQLAQVLMCSNEFSFVD